MLHVNKREYEKFEQENKQISSIKSLLYERKLEKLGEKLLEASQREENLRKEVVLLATEREVKEQEAEEVSRFFAKTERQLEETHNKGDSAENEIFGNSIKRQEDMMTAKKKQQAEVENDILVLEKEIAKFEQTKVATEKKILELQQQKEIITNHTELGSVGSNKGEFIKPKISNLKTLSSNLREKADKLAKEERELEATVNENRLEVETVEAQKKEFEQRYNELLSHKQKIQNSSSVSNSKLKEISSRVAAQEEQLVSHFDEFVRKSKIISGKRFNIDLVHLLAVINLYKRRNPGRFVSFLVDCIAFPEKLAVAFESLYLSKLFALVVEDEEAAQDILAINKELRGGRITILPLSTSSSCFKPDTSIINNTSISMSRDIELEDSDYVLMKNFVGLGPLDSQHYDASLLVVERLLEIQRRHKSTHIDEYFQGLLAFKGDNLSSALSNFFSSGRDGIQAEGSLSQKTSQDIQSSQLLAKYHSQADELIQKLFKKGALVKNIDIATSIAHDQHLNCATPEGEVVFSGGYMARIGGVESSRGALTIYAEIQSIFESLQTILVDLQDLYNSKAEIESSGFSSNKDLRAIEKELRENETAIKIFAERITSLRQQNFAKTQELFNVKNELMRKATGIESNQNNLQLLDAVSTGKGADSLKKKFSIESVPKITNQIEQLVQELSEIQKQLHNKRSSFVKNLNILEKANQFDEQETDMSAESMKRGNHSTKPFRSERKDSETKAIEEELKRLEKKKKNIEKDLESLNIRCEKAYGQQSLAATHKENFEKLVWDTEQKLVSL
jgi:chromosome segregation ATPase